MLARVLNVISSLITVLQFVLVIVVPHFDPDFENPVLDFSIETRATCFLLVELLILFIGYTIVRNLAGRVRDAVGLIFVFALAVIVVDYLSTINFRMTWGAFKPFIPFVTRNGNIYHTVFLGLTSIVSWEISNSVAASMGWSLRS